MHLSSLIKQKEYEKIIYTLRRDGITFVPQIFLFLILSSIPIIIYFFLTGSFPGVIENQVVYTLLTLGASIFYLSILLFFYTEFTVFYLDVSIVTNDRIIEMEQLSLFSRTTSELELFRIQDITSEVDGIFASLFHYGNVRVTTASENTQIVFFDIPHPEKIREELIKLSHEDRKYHMGVSTLEEH
jgi:membrane protein YdbS with pleckstrin-like domain